MASRVCVGCSEHTVESGGLGIHTPQLLLQKCAELVSQVGRPRRPEQRSKAVVSAGVRDERQRKVRTAARISSGVSSTVIRISSISSSGSGGRAVGGRQEQEQQRRMDDARARLQSPGAETRTAIHCAPVHVPSTPPIAGSLT